MVVMISIQASSLLRATCIYSEIMPLFKIDHVSMTNGSNWTSVSEEPRGDEVCAIIGYSGTCTKCSRTPLPLGSFGPFEKQYWILLIMKCHLQFWNFEFTRSEVAMFNFSAFPFSYQTVEVSSSIHLESGDRTAVSHCIWAQRCDP